MCGVLSFEMVDVATMCAGKTEFIKINLHISNKSIIFAD